MHLFCFTKTDDRAEALSNRKRTTSGRSSGPKENPGIVKITINANEGIQQLETTDEDETKREQKEKTLKKA